MRTKERSRKLCKFLCLSHLILISHATLSRNAAKTAHPDKGGSESKMATVNEAYEVLSKPDLRARYDAGDDPNDPMGGYESQGPRYGGFGGDFGGSGHPFSQFFQQSTFK